MLVFILVTNSILEETITDEWKFFPRMHKLLATKPNAIPPVITTGVGPAGRKVRFFQAPDGTTMASQSESADVQHGYATMLEVLASAQRAAAAAGQPLSHSAPGDEEFGGGADMDDVATSAPRGAVLAPVRNTHTTPKANAAAAAAKLLVEKAKSTIKKIPPKASLEDTLMKLSKCVVLFLCLRSWLISYSERTCLLLVR